MIIDDVTSLEDKKVTTEKDVATPEVNAAELLNTFRATSGASIFAGLFEMSAKVESALAKTDEGQSSLRRQKR